MYTPPTHTHKIILKVMSTDLDDFICTFANGSSQRSVLVGQMLASGIYFPIEVIGKLTIVGL